MSLRFNPPPGWQVPDGFVPPQGWQPDPSWPAAPPGWEYWTDDNGAGTSGFQGQNASPGSRVQGDPLTYHRHKRAQARTQMITGLLMFAMMVALFIFTDRLFAFLGVVGAISALAGVVGYLKADKEVRALSPISDLGGAPSYTGTDYGTTTAPPTITQVSTHLKNDDGTMPGQWKV